MRSITNNKSWVNAFFFQVFYLINQCFWVNNYTITNNTEGVTINNTWRNKMKFEYFSVNYNSCLLYTSDAADE